jgi:twitching motility protein PilT
MSKLTPLLEAMQRAGAEEMHLLPGEKIYVLRGGERLDVGREPVSPASLEGLAAELAPPGTSGEPLTVAVSHGGTAFRVEVERGPAGLVILIRRGDGIAPAFIPPPAFAMAPRSGGSAAAETEGKAIDRYLRRMMELGSSDLHLSAESRPAVRIDGEVRTLAEFPVLSSADIAALLEEIFTNKAHRDFETRNDADFAYEVPGLARFRVNAFRDRKGVGTVLRQIPIEVITAEQLRLPKAILEFCRLSKGLVVVTGPTGSGKSTTLAAMVDHINKTRTDHIITIEDPVEFVHSNIKCLVNQREVGSHTESFKNALRAALREDPDIVLVGEMRDLETVSIALETAETGHLVFGTLHTTTAVSTVDRIIDQFPTNQQAQIRVMLAEALRGVVAQVLCKKIGGGRVAAMEILIANMAVTALIREGKNFQIPSIMQTNRALGMVTMNESLMALVRDKVIEPAEAYFKATDKTGLLGLMKSSNIPTTFLGT